MDETHPRWPARSEGNPQPHERGAANQGSRTVLGSLVDQGGVVALLAMNGLFVLITNTICHSWAVYDSWS